MSLLPPKLSRYAAIATLLLKYWRVAPTGDDPLAATAPDDADRQDTA